MIFQDFGRTEKKLLLLVLSLLFYWWLWGGCATASASRTPEPMYQITESELMTLETNLAQLRSANERLQVDLKAQSSEATQLKKELAALRKELSDLKALSVTQESSLTNANRLLEEYAIEAKRERLRIKAQRNGWAAAAACLAVALVVKS